MLGMTWWLAGLTTEVCGIAFVANDIATQRPVFGATIFGPILLSIGVVCCAIAVARGAHRRTVVINTSLSRITIHYHRFGRHVYCERISVNDVDVIKCRLCLLRFRYAESYDYHALILIAKAQSIVLAAVEEQVEYCEMQSLIEVVAGLNVRGTDIEIIAPGFRYC